MSTDPRIREIDSTASKMAQALQNVLGTAIDLKYSPSSPIRDILREEQLRLYEVGLFAEQEMFRANEAGAYFAACLSGAAMNEALLAFLCFIHERDVLATKQFAYSRKAKGNKAFKQIISSWQLQQFINVAQELDWIPSDVVDAKIKAALSDGYREVMPVTHPELAAEDIEQGAQDFHDDAGTAILAFTQEIRNLIHAGRWLKMKSGFVEQHFSKWCQFAVFVFGEVRVCLITKISNDMSTRFEEQLARIEGMVSQFPPELKEAFLLMVRSRLDERSE